MAYWMLLVSKDPACPPLDVIEVPLFSDFEADYRICGGTEADWREVELRFTSDDDELATDADDFATIYRAVGPDQLDEQLSEMMEGLDDVRPAAAADWVRRWLAGTHTIYSFTPHHPTRHEEAMSALRAVMWCIQRNTASISYAEGEGWSNQDGHLVTWEFDDEHGLQGPWWCAVLDPSGNWVAFQLDLGNAEQRRAFREGRVPDGLTPLRR